MKVSATCKYLRRSPFKMRRFAQLIKGESYEKAVSVLTVSSSPACFELLKVLKSAGANAENNLGLYKDGLRVYTVMVDEGTTMKRFHARARGRPGPILKRTSHITVVLEEINPTQETA